MRPLKSNRKPRCHEAEYITAFGANVTAFEANVTAFEANVTAFEANVTAFEANVTASGRNITAFGGKCGYAGWQETGEVSLYNRKTS